MTKPKQPSLLPMERQRLPLARHRELCQRIRILVQSAPDIDTDLALRRHHEAQERAALKQWAKK